MLTVTEGAELVLSEVSRQLPLLPPLILYRAPDQSWSRIRVRSGGKYGGLTAVADERSELDDVLQSTVKMLSTRGASAARSMLSRNTDDQRRQA